MAAFGFGLSPGHMTTLVAFRQGFVDVRCIWEVKNMKMTIVLKKEGKTDAAVISPMLQIGWEIYS